MIKRKGNRGETQVHETLHQLLTRIELLEESIKKQPINIRIEQVYVDRPVLEKLSFQLEGIDIEELSGSLNMGNNFGIDNGSAVRTERSGRSPTDKHNKKQDSKESTHASETDRAKRAKPASNRRTSKSNSTSERMDRSDEQMDWNGQSRPIDSTDITDSIHILKTRSGYSVKYANESV